MRIISALIASSALALTAPAFAQYSHPSTPAAPPAPAPVTVTTSNVVISPGMQVVDTTGASVGTVTTVKGDTVAIKTDKYETFVPKTSFAMNAGKLTFSMTQAELNAEIEKSQAASKASLVAGATVKDMEGVEIGKIDSVNPTGVVIVLTSGQKIQVAPTGVRGNKDGTVTAGVHAAQLPQAPAKPAASTPAKPRK
jgi:hypothetical protein